MALRTLAPLTPGSDFYSTMRQWQQSLKPLLAVTQPPSVTMSFSAKGVANGVLLAWGLSTANAGVDGFIIQRSTTGDFSQNVVSISIPSSQQTSYLDPQASGTFYYRIIATSGTVQNPQQNQGKPSGVVSATVNSSTTTYDTSQNGVPAKNFGSVLQPVITVNRGGVKF